MHLLFRDRLVHDHHWWLGPTQWGRTGWGKLDHRSNLPWPGRGDVELAGGDDRFMTTNPIELKHVACDGTNLLGFYVISDGARHP